MVSGTQNPSSGNALQGWPVCEQNQQAGCSGRPSFEKLSVRFLWMGAPWTVPPPASLQARLFWHSGSGEGGRGLLSSQDWQFPSGPHP